jgi:hypothetical protein
MGKKNNQSNKQCRETTYGWFFVPEIHACAYPVLTGCNELQSPAWQCRIERVASSIENQAALPVFRYSSGKGAC